MIFLALSLHIFLFLSLLFLTNFKKNYFNPVYFLVYANYFYFFILWFLWYFLNPQYVEKYQVGYYITLLYAIGFIIGVVYAQNININVINKISYIFPKSKFIFFKTENLFLVFFILALILIYFMYKTFQTLNPIEVLIQLEAQKQSGIIYKTGISYVYKPIQVFLTILFCFIVYNSYKENKTMYIYLSLIIFIYLSLAFGSKSLVVEPLFWWALIKHAFFKKISLKNILIVGIIILLFIPFLEIIRQNLFEKMESNLLMNVIHVLVGRINMELYLTKYFEMGYNIDYPNSLFHFFTYFIPRNILSEFGIEKPIPFGLAFTRYVTQRPEVYMTVAGGGIGEWIHDFSIFSNKYIIFFSILLGGFIGGIINGILYKLSKYAVCKNNITLFIIIILFLHIGTLFEFSFSYVVGTLETLFTIIFLILISNIFILKKRAF